MNQLTLDGQDTRIIVTEIEKGRWMDQAYGAKCANCGQWLTKWDFTPEDAEACAKQALDRDHHCEIT